MAALDKVTVDANAETPWQPDTESHLPAADESASGWDPEDPTARVVRVEQLVEEHHPAIYRYAYWLTGCPSAAEDISQDVFVRAFRGLHTLREPRAAKSWLMTITRNEFARWCQKRGPRPVDDVPDNVPARDEPTDQLDSREWVAQGLSELAVEFRLVLLMYYFEQLTYNEIATRLSIPIGTVMSRLSRGREHLKHALQRLSEPKSH